MSDLRNRIATKTALYILLIGAGVLTAFPLLWMVSASFMQTGEANTIPPPLLDREVERGVVVEALLIRVGAVFEQQLHDLLGPSLRPVGDRCDDRRESVVLLRGRLGSQLEQPTHEVHRRVIDRVFQARPDGHRHGSVRKGVRFRHAGPNGLEISGPEGRVQFENLIPVHSA